MRGAFSSKIWREVCSLRTSCLAQITTLTLETHLDSQTQGLMHRYFCLPSCWKGRFMMHVMRWLTFLASLKYEIRSRCMNLCSDYTLVKEISLSKQREFRCFLAGTIKAVEDRQGLGICWTEHDRKLQCGHSHKSRANPSMLITVFWVLLYFGVLKCTRKALLLAEEKLASNCQKKKKTT